MIIRRIGLTGGIGAGKSTVAQLWRRAGETVIDLDALSRAVLDVPGAGVDEAVARFGRGILLPSGTVDRSGLAAIVFADPRARRDLEEIVLTRVDVEVERAETEAARHGAQVVVHDSPLLLEKRREGDMDVVVSVLARRTDRIARIAQDRGRDRDYAESVMAAQVSDLERIRRSDLLILNTGDTTTLRDRAAAQRVRAHALLDARESTGAHRG